MQGIHTADIYMNFFFLFIFVRAVLASGVEFFSFYLSGLKQSQHVFEGCKTQKHRMVGAGRVF